MIVVGEHELEGHWIRYLRADHSILGGLWIGQARDDLRLSSLDGNIDESEAVRNAESIYVRSFLHSPSRFRPSLRHEVDLYPALLLIFAYFGDNTSLHSACRRL